jgi:hypothetical protein
LAIDMSHLLLHPPIGTSGRPTSASSSSLVTYMRVRAKIMGLVIPRTG